MAISRRKFSTGSKRLEQVVRNSLGEKADRKKLVPAMLGAYVDGQATIKVNGRPDFVWARIRSATSEVVQVYNDKVSEIWELPVLIYRDPENPDIWRIDGRDVRRYQSWGGVSSIPPHGNHHSFSSADNTGIDPVWVFKRQYMPFLPRPVFSGTMQVYIEPEFYQWAGLYHWFGGTGTADLSSYRPTGGSNGLFLTIYLEGITGQIKYTKGPEFPAYDPPADPGRYITLPSAHDAVPIAAVFLTTGTSHIGWGEIYDLRYPMTELVGSGSYLHMYSAGRAIGDVESLDFLGAGVSITKSGTRGVITIPGGGGGGNIGFYGLDDGVPLGTGTSVDWGAGLTASLSGTRFDVKVAPPITGSVVVYDDATLKGSATRLVFGDNLDVSMSGTIAWIDGQAGGGGGGAGVMMWDDGVPLGTGTVIDWGDNLDVSLSGGVLRVDAQAGGGGAGTPLSVTTGIHRTYALIERQTIVTPTGTIHFTQIPQIYKHLYIETRARSSIAATTEDILLALNGDTTAANYRAQIHVAVDGTHNIFPGDARPGGSMPGATALAGDFNFGEIFIQDYTLTGIHTEYTVKEGERRAAASTLILHEFVNWEKYEAVTLISLASSANTFVSGSQFALYGVRDEAIVTNVSGNAVYGGMVIQDDGNPIATGSILDFGNDLDVSVSGSVIRVDVPYASTGTFMIGQLVDRQVPDASGFIELLVPTGVAWDYLELILRARGKRSGNTIEVVNITFNGDTGTNYNSAYGGFQADNNISTSGVDGPNVRQIRGPSLPAGSSPAGYFAYSTTRITLPHIYGVQGVIGNGQLAEATSTTAQQRADAWGGDYHVNSPITRVNLRGFFDHRLETGTYAELYGYRQRAIVMAD